MAPPQSKRRRCLHLGACPGRRQKEKEKSNKQREATWNHSILVTESEDSVVPWNVNGILGGEITTNSEGVIPLTFVSFSQCVVGDVIQLLLFKVGGWATEQLAFREPQV